LQEYGELTITLSWTLLSAQAEQLDYSPKAAGQKLERYFLAHKFSEVGDLMLSNPFAFDRGNDFSINQFTLYTALN